MTGAKVIARNLFANWIAHASNLVVLFFLSPFVVHTLGQTQYGIWQILSVLTGYMGVLDLGVRASTGRYIVLYLGKKDFVKVDETIRTGLGMYSVLGGLVLVAGFILGALFPRLFPTVPQEYSLTVAILLPMLAVNIWISAVRTVLSSVLVAHDRFDFARGSDLVMLAVRTLGTILALTWGFGLVGLAVVVICCNIVGLIVNFLLARWVHHGLCLWPLQFKKERISELYRYGIGAFAITVCGKIIGQTDLIIVGNLIHLDAVAVYSVGAMLLYYSDTLLSQITTTFFPPLQRAVAQGDMITARMLVFRQTRLALILGLLIFVGYSTFCEPFIRLWMFNSVSFPMDSVNQAAQVMTILAFSKLLLLFGFGSRTILSATGHIGFAAKMTIVESFTNLVLSIVFVVVFNLGLAGVALGTLVARVLTSAAIVPLYACRKIGINLWHYTFEIGGRGLVAGVVIAWICYAVQRQLPSGNWFEFFTQVAVATLCYIPVAFMVIVPRDDQRAMFVKLRGLLGGV